MPPTPRTPAHDAPLPRPAGLVAVLVAVAAEVLGLVALMGWGLVQLVRDPDARTGVTVTLLLFAALVAAGLVASARVLARGRRTGRAPVATWQLLQGATALAVAQATDRPLAWIVVGVSAVVFLLMLSPRVVAFTTLR